MLVRKIVRASCAGQECYQAQDLRSGQQGILGGQISAFLRHTIHTAQVALLSQGYPQVRMLPPEYHESLHNPHKPYANLSNVNDTSYDSACIAAQWPYTCKSVQPILSIE